MNHLEIHGGPPSDGDRRYALYAIMNIVKYGGPFMSQGWFPIDGARAHAVDRTSHGNDWP